MSESRNKSIRRALSPLRLLKRRGSFTDAEVVEEADCSLQQAQRIRRAVAECVDLTWTRGPGGVRRYAATTAPSVSLTTGEAAALALADGLMGVVSDTTLFDDWGDAVVKLRQAMPAKSEASFAAVASALVVTLKSRSKPALVSEALEAHLDAIIRGGAVRTTYVGASGSREVVFCPWSLVVCSGRVYGFGAVQGATEPRLLRLDAMRNPAWQAKSDQWGEPEPGFDMRSVLKHSIGVWVSTAPPDTIVLEFTLEAALYVARTRFHTSQNHESLPDGRVQLTMFVKATEEVEAWILSFGERVRVVQPQHLADKIGMRQRAAAIVRHGA